MLRQSSSRNHRSKGLKLKKIVQISLLVLVSVWLLYQVKHSYEKKSYSEDEVKVLHKDDKNQDIIRVGRKELPTRIDADSSTLDERTEDDTNDEMEQEMKHDENDEDPIDEQDLDKDDDLPEPSEHSSDKGGDGVGVFEDEERKERSQEDQEKSFHGDNVSSAVSHDPPPSEREVLPHHAQEKILFVDDASTAVPHEKQETRHEEELRMAREKSFRGDDVSSSVDHDAKVTKPLPDEQLNNMDRIFEGTTNLSNRISFRGPGVNGSNATEEQHAATLTNASTHLNANIPNLDSESNVHPTPVNLTSKRDRTNLTLKGEQQVNSTSVLNNQVQLLADQTSSVELHSPPNNTLSSVTGAQESTSGGDNDNSTGSSSTTVDKKVEGGDARKENMDVSAKIVNGAMTEDEVLPE